MIPAITKCIHRFYARLIYGSPILITYPLAIAAPLTGATQGPRVSAFDLASPAYCTSEENILSWSAASMLLRCFAFS